MVTKLESNVSPVLYNDSILLWVTSLVEVSYTKNFSPVSDVRIGLT